MSANARSTTLTIAAALALAAAPAGAQTKRALVIGIDRYEQPATVLASWRKAAEPTIREWRMRVGNVAQAGMNGGAADASADARATVHSLDGSVNDAESIATTLVARYHFPAANVHVLRNTQATRAGILAAVEQLIGESQKGDVVVFYYAGHGSQRVNSLADVKLNHLDQTIVPVDANAGQFDIRNTELAALFDRLVDKGVELTLIFDSCHSGAITRGETVPTKKRWASADPRDARDAERPTPPEDKPHGAILLAAAADYESAEEAVDPRSAKSHGAFTLALLRALQQSPVTDEPAAVVFDRTKAILQENDRPQHPALRFPAGDERRALFGGVSGALANRVTLALQRVDGDTVLLQGGSALGLAPKSELRLADTTKGRGALRLRVVAVPGLATSKAVATTGHASDRKLESGTLFVVDRWAEPEQPALRAWIPASIAAGELRSAVAALAPLHASRVAEWVDDPTTLPDDGRPLYVARHDAGGWRLQAPTGELVALASPSADAVERAVSEAEAQARERAAREAAAVKQTPAARGAPRLFVILPPTPALRAQIAVGSGTEQPGIAVQADPRGADYLLVGRDSAGAVSYGWLQPNVRRAAEERRSLPVRTDWYRSANDSLVGDSLTGAAVRLARVTGWLDIRPPADAAPFPYRLYLRQRQTGELKDSGTTRGGEEYELVLRRDPSIDPQHIPARWVSVFVIDSWGKGTLLYSPENTIPYDSVGTKMAPAEIKLVRPRPVRITPPYGTDTFILVSSDEQVDPQVFRFQGVRTRDAARGITERGEKGSLTNLFSRVTGATRGADDGLPTDWSIERVPLRSVGSTP